MNSKIIIAAVIGVCLVALAIGLGVGLSGKSEKPEYTTESPDYTTESPEIPENVKTLRDYVFRDDGYFRWSRTAWSDNQGANYDNLINELRVESIDLIRLTSQKWLNQSYVSKSIWEHNVWICVPKATNQSIDSAILWIENGNNEEFEPSFKTQEKLLCEIGQLTNSVMVYLRQIPNEPIVFYDDPNLYPVKEDGLIAYTWRTFLEGKEGPEVLLRFPMVKAAIRAMDMASEYVQLFEKRPGPLTKWCVGGGSKRAWTSWITAAADPDRVKCIVPLVDDMVDVQKVMHHHYQSLGGWTYSFWEYWSRDIMKYLDTDRFKEMCSYMDPFYYKDILKDIPKSVISGSGDFLFLIDDAFAWWDDIWMENSYLRILPNVMHDAGGHAKYTNQVAMAFIALQQAMVLDEKMPEMKWEIDRENHMIKACTNQEVYKAVIFQGVSESPLGRDFRLLRIADNAEVPPSPNSPHYDDRVPSLKDQPDDQKQNIDIFKMKRICHYNQTFPVDGPRPNIKCDDISVTHNPENNNQYCFEYGPIEPSPSGNYSATYMELNWAMQPNNRHFTATTGAYILPDEYLYDDCQGEKDGPSEACVGHLV